jgi:hypothetical protein
MNKWKPSTADTHEQSCKLKFLNSHPSKTTFVWIFEIVMIDYKFQNYITKSKKKRKETPERISLAIWIKLQSLIVMVPFPVSLIILLEILPETFPMRKKKFFLK